MDLDERLEKISTQERAYTEGTVECIGDEWVFFDDLNEKAFQLNELETKFEIFSDGTWVHCTYIEHGIVQTPKASKYLQDGDIIRFYKELTITYQQLLEELPEGSFQGFIHTLNLLSFSLFDCIYCHNFLTFLTKRESKQGVNTMIFDNEEQVCTVQHHFSRNPYKDRFEFTLSDGTRSICGNV